MSRNQTREINLPISWPEARRWTLRIMVVWVSLWAPVSFGQDADPNTTQVIAPAAKAETTSLPVKPEATRPAVKAITVAGIDAAIKRIADLSELDDPTKAKVKELYVQAKAKLELVATEQKTAAQFNAWIKSANEDIDQAKHHKELPPQAYDIDAAKNPERKLNELKKDRTSLEQQLTEAKKALLAARAEPQRRVDRKTEIPTEISAAKTALEELEQQLAGLASGDDASVVTRARMTLLRARQQARFASIASLERERDAYESQGELPRLRIDLATTQLKQLEQDVQQLVEIITERRTTDATAQVEDAEKAWQAASSLLKPYAQNNIDLAKLRIKLANGIHLAVAGRRQIGKQLERWQKDFARTQERAEAVNFDTLGLMLVEKRASLPSTSLLRRSVAEREGRIREFREELYQLEDRRAGLADVNAKVTTALEELHDNGSEPSAEAEDSLQKLFDREVQILDSLLEDANRNYSLGIAAKEDQQQLLRVLQQYGEFIDTRVFWARSAAPLRFEEISSAREAFAWLANVETWQSMQDTLVARARRHPLGTILFGASLALLVFYRRKFRRKLYELGQVASAISCQSIWPTMQALLLTILLTAPWPLLVATISWGLADSLSQPVRAISSALSTMALWLLLFESARQVWRPNGLAQAHFGWSTRVATVLRSHLFVLLIVGTPLVFFGSVFQRHGDPLYLTSLGRFCFIALMPLLAYTLFRLFQRNSGVVSELVSQDPTGWLKGLRNIWYPSVVLLPIALAVLAIRGFQYTSYRLTVDLLFSFALVFSLSLVGAMLFRWVRVKRRNLRRQQLIEARQRRASESETSELEALAAKEEEVDLVAMDHQSRRLIGGLLVCIGLMGFSAIWYEVLPALTPLVERVLWEVEGVGGEAKPITVGAMLLAALVVVIAILASRNIPGLVNVMSLGRLGIESSTRYAISTLSQYAIIIAGVLVACGTLGLTWGKAQWLVAALGVGLGFGLQEVVANFVCGILLLFERPIRVGDIVTLGETTGAVIRIRSRATTVLNWDRQEVVIPNKELITGRIVNWTLTDQLNRVTLEVGIAYGSNTNQARELLRQIANENRNVLNDPPPIVTFDRFGDSTLNFTVRAYLANMDERLETIHELHSCINMRFAEEGIEIAFPQHDLHLRSVDPSVRFTDSDPKTTS